MAASAAMVIVGCAGPPTDSDGWAPPAPTLPQAVHGTGTVLEGDAGPVLCLGPIAESYPPQCDGPAILGWDWSAVTEGWQSASGIMWGAYAVWGDWDGETFTVTREPVPAALHDPTNDFSKADPWDESRPRGTLSEAGAERVRAELERVVPGVLGSAIVHGRLVLEVRFDDGTLQEAIDERYGDDAVVVIPSLVPTS